MQSTKALPMKQRLSNLEASSPPLEVMDLNFNIKYSQSPRGKLFVEQGRYHNLLLFNSVQDGGNSLFQPAITAVLKPQNALDKALHHQENSTVVHQTQAQQG